jgi:hypothetical protein
MDKKVREYINKQKSPQREICKKLRKLILKTLPKAKEEMKWGVPVFGGGKFYIGALRDHVNLGFAVTGLSEREKSLFEGRGKMMRHIKIAKVEDIDDKKIAKLLKMVYKKATCDESC